MSATHVNTVSWSTHQMTNQKPTNTGDPLTKYLTVTYLSDGNIDVESNDMTVFDLWAMSNYLKMRADEMYISVQTQKNVTEAAKRPQIVTTGQMPRKAGRVAPIRSD